MRFSLECLHVATLAVAVLAAAFLRAGEVDGAGPMIDAARAADIVVVGEVHDNPGHHETQAQIVSELRPRAVVFEMLTAGQARVANNADASGVDLGAILGWSESGWPDFELYAPIFSAAEAAGARIYGAAVPFEAIKTAMSAGPAQAFSKNARDYGLDAPLDPSEASAREAGQMQAHCDALPEEMLPGMVAAQRLRDAEFARAAIEALRATGGPVVLVTGNGHARTDWGVPRYVARAAPDVRLVSIGQIEASETPVSDPPFDVWQVTAGIDRPDPCAAFEAG